MNAPPKAASGRAHPFLAFDASDLPAMRESVRVSPRSTWMDAVRASAEAGLSFEPGGTSESQQSSFAVNLAYAYLIDQDARYLEKAASLLSQAGDFDTDWDTFGWTWAGDMLNYAYAYDFVASALSAEQNTTILGKLSDAGAKTMTNLPLPVVTGGFFYIVNIRLRIDGGLGALAAAMDGYGEATAWFEYVLEDLFGIGHQRVDLPGRYVTTCVTEAGTYNEGPSYQSDAFGVLLPFLLITKRLTGQDYLTGEGVPRELATDGRLARMWERDIRITMPDQATGTVDTGWQTSLAYTALAAPALGRERGAEVQWLWEQVVGGDKTLGSGNPVLDLLYADPDMPSRAPLSLSLVTADWTSFRSGFDKNDLFFLMQNGSVPVYSHHAQPAQTSFLAFAFGQLLLLDPGDGRNYEGAAERDWIAQNPGAHNLVIPDDRASSSQSRQAPARIHDYTAMTDPVTVLTSRVSERLDVSRVAMSYVNVAGLSTVRTAALVRKRYLVIFDEMSVSDGAAHTYDAQLHFGGALETNSVTGELQVAGELSGQGGAWTWSTSTDCGLPIALDIVYAPPPTSMTELSGPTNLVNGTTFSHPLTKARYEGGALSWLSVLSPRLASDTPAVIAEVPVTGGAGSAVTVTDATGSELLFVSDGAVAIATTSPAASFCGRAAILLLSDGEVAEAQLFEALSLSDSRGPLLSSSRPVHAFVRAGLPELRAEVDVPASGARIAMPVSNDKMRLVVDGLTTLGGYDRAAKSAYADVPAGRHTIEVPQATKSAPSTFRGYPERSGRRGYKGDPA